MKQAPDNIFDGLGLPERDEPMEAIYQASRMRDEQAVIRMLDEHLAQHGEPEQQAYANRAEHRQDDADMGRFPYHTGGNTWSPSDADAIALIPEECRGQQEVQFQKQIRRQ
ncbi:hypothetical protein N799_05345 [Lysobacter arseniciresistens ZS79]|uniref:Uncharacterized protein n=1 Tax=Lysobacter arseniciresistens ZS79 TaxID=913325 RepID=A0A0A0F4P6_9GAMM|nr:hypothetical protein [Lysobacter arseniciresistens]KGM57490.1 hypothetical protein N799_05345 [Lysobacter arseniciresistens ZS79]